MMDLVAFAERVQAVYDEHVREPQRPERRAASAHVRARRQAQLADRADQQERAQWKALEDLAEGGGRRYGVPAGGSFV